jgi:DNA processing protein
MTTDLIYQLALTEVPHIGQVHAKSLSEHFGSAEEIFKAPRGLLEKIDGIGEIRARSIKYFKNFKGAENEIRFIHKYKIETYFLTDRGYPQRLLNCDDPPTLLFYRGNANLNASRIVSVVGTRNNSEYGKMLTEKFIQELESFEVVVLSGLAYGIDALAHKACIKYQVPTIGVLAHGLDTIYPVEHAALARSMTKNGGLLSEFKSKTKPDKHNFPSRNRIVAGMSDAVIVVETGVKGGSLITADLADGYHRDVFAFPGRTTDMKSTGCNHLIKNNKAVLLNDPKQFVETMGWLDCSSTKSRAARELFPELNDNEKIIVSLLREQAQVHIDELMFKSGLSSSMTAAVILGLELRSIIATLPGKRLSLL